MTQLKTTVLLFAGMCLLWLAGCSPTSGQVEPALEMTETAVPTEQPADTSDNPAATPTRAIKPFVPAQATPAGPGAPSTLPDSPASQAQIQEAKEALADNLGVPVEKIELVSYEAVTWQDSSLGCPRPGLDYLQVLRDGYRIRLQVKDQQYEYHGANDSDSAPFLCANPDAGSGSGNMK